MIKVDWQSSEKMYFADIWYEQGVVVDQNMDPIINGSGSCIFLHNWSTPDETTAGCTEMEPVNLKKIIYWLDSSANPILVQLTKELYNEYKAILEAALKLIFKIDRITHKVSMNLKLNDQCI